MSTEAKHTPKRIKLSGNMVTIPLQQGFGDPSESFAELLAACEALLNAHGAHESEKSLHDHWAPLRAAIAKAGGAR